jgi:hypothetical protein
MRDNNKFTGTILDLLQQVRIRPSPLITPSSLLFRGLTLHSLLDLL